MYVELIVEKMNQMKMIDKENMDKDGQRYIKYTIVLAIVNKLYYLKQ